MLRPRRRDYPRSRFALLRFADVAGVLGAVSAARLRCTIPRVDALVVFEH